MKIIKSLIIIILMFMITIVLIACNTPTDEESFLDTLEKTQVTRVVDGDTVVIASGEKVRFILINTPESVHPNASRNTEFGKIASDYTRDKLLNKTIYLEKDVSNTDRYGRLLRYVYLEDGTFFNELLVKEGYAQLATFPPDIKYLDMILTAENYARDHHLGLWGYDATEQTSSQGNYVGSVNSDKVHELDCVHVASILEKNLIYFDSVEEAKSQGYSQCKSCQPSDQ